ncbi:unnamed protein product [Effrenium voratum]|uniref:Protein kinase domain-containing protein n=1 Tax=Effrenium voratum TaxID=2562239 RepID=A0AA36NH72_9DINO|nr:unnamed protein product [Effrenium voratum]
MLTWIAMLTCTHFFMNLRWYTLLPCQISGLLSYMFCAALGSPEGVLLVMNLALFAGITALASLAKRGLEHHERHSMLQLISERVRRFESDFKLEQARAAPLLIGALRRAGFIRLLCSCVQGQTGFTQMIFDVKNNCRDQLDSMMKLGEQEHWLVEARGSVTEMAKQLRFDPKELIGRGNYGVILAGDMLGMPVAVKLPLANASLSLPDLANELRFLRRVRHPHIVAFQGGAFRSLGNFPQEMLFLVEELVEGASLQALSQDKLNLETNQKHAVLLGICRALRYLHGLRPAIAHGDLKPTNVLITTRALDGHFAGGGGDQHVSPGAS